MEIAAVKKHRRRRSLLRFSGNSEQSFPQGSLSFTEIKF
jgi:hypothetical protein